MTKIEKELVERECKRWFDENYNFEKIDESYLEIESVEQCFDTNDNTITIVCGLTDKEGKTFFQRTVKVIANFKDQSRFIAGMFAHAMLSYEIEDIGVVENYEKELDK